MKAPLDGAVTRDAVLAATDYVAPSIDILDTRIQRVDAANAGIVLGARRPPPEAVDLRWVGAIVKRDDAVVATGLGAAVFDDPVTGLVWLTRRMAQYGQRIEAGPIILSGSFIGPVECLAGTRVHADFGSLGAVSVDFD